MWVPDPLYLKALHTPQHVALYTPHQAWTFAAMEQEVNGIVSLCQQWRIAPGDRVALLGDNSPEYLFWLWGLTRLGAVTLLLNTRLSLTNLVDQLQDSNIQLLLHDPLHAATAQSVTETSGVRTAPLIASVPSERPLPPLLRWKDLHSIFFTSGTTGKPKGVTLTVQNHYASAVGVLQHLAIRSPFLAWLVCLPLFHVGGVAVLWRSLLGGFPLALLPRFTEATVLQAVASGKVGYISLVPTMLYRLLHHPEFLPHLSHWQQLQGIVIGGASLGAGLQSYCQELKLPILLSYGLTEAASQVTTLLGKDLARKQGSSGLPLPGIEVGIAVGEGGIGEIMLRGPQVMAGYLHYPPQAGWFATGDIGCLDGEGYLYVLDRRSDLIVSGGENIYPSEIEDILSRHPQIEEVCVIGIPDREWGMVVGVVYRSVKVFSLEEIQEFCTAQHLARYKVPRVIYPIAEFPKSAAGKIQRSVVREKVWGTKTTDLNLKNCAQPEEALPDKDSADGDRRQQ